MLIKVLLFTIIVFLQPGKVVKSVEILFRDGKIVNFEEVGLFVSGNDKLQQSLKVHWQGSYFWLHFKGVSEIEFKKIKKETLSADVLFSNGSIKEFEIFQNVLTCKNGEERIIVSLASIKKIKFVNK